VECQPDTDVSALLCRGTLHTNCVVDMAVLASALLYMEANGLTSNRHTRAYSVHFPIYCVRHHEHHLHSVISEGVTDISSSD